MQCCILLEGNTLFCHHVADIELALHSFSFQLLQHQQRTCSWHVTHNRLLPCFRLGSAKMRHRCYMLIASSMVEQVAICSLMIPKTSYPCLWVVFHRANFAFVLSANHAPQHSYIVLVLSVHITFQSCKRLMVFVIITLPLLESRNCQLTFCFLRCAVTRIGSCWY